MTTRHAGQKHGEESIKETIESIVIAFILAFVFRAYVVEAFVIPTGSMAPTLLGRHIRVVCRQCGYPFAVDTPRRHDTVSVLQGEGVVSCPMCHFPNVLPVGTAISAGDRILVQKYIYSLTEPQRWDVLVFKAPHDPDTNYIKRLVGLPNERLWLIEGNIYVQSIGKDPDAPWRIARKPESVQRAIWQPVYHGRYDPLDNGRNSVGRAQFPWRQPWVVDEPARWQRWGHSGYRYTGTEAAVIRFDFLRVMEGSAGLYGYNQLKHQSVEFSPVEDVRVMASFLPETAGVSVSLRTTARMDHPTGQSLELVGRVDALGNATLLSRNPSSGQTTELTKPVQVAAMTSAKATTMELWYVDQEASLWVDGRPVQVCQFDLPIEIVKDRQEPRGLPKIAVEVEGGTVVVQRLAVDRDLYYTSTKPSGDAARGALLKERVTSEGEPVVLNDDQFFCCGDNSPLSQDSRFWTRVNPWILKRLFEEGTEPEEALGIVPRQLIMGKAFFVYFPTPLRVAGTKPSWIPIPNFGDMRFIH